MGFLDKLPGMSNAGSAGMRWRKPILKSRSRKWKRLLPVQSMTLKERRNPDLMNPDPVEKRIAAGCGMEVAEKSTS